jgi:serine/threonine protein phosphatase PrpC
MALTHAEAPAVERQLELRTPFGRPVAWAEVAMVSDIGDSHELNDDRCLVVTSRELGYGADSPLGDFMLCLLADGATGSTFARHVAAGQAGVRSLQAGWRASQLAQAAFVERFLGSAEVDILDRLKDGLRAADQALVDSGEGRLSTTLTALFLSADGHAFGASIGDSVLLVLPPTRRNPGDRRVKKLGYETTTAVGSGDTTLSYVDDAELIEQWWPDKEATSGGQVHTRVRPGTRFVMMSDGISDNLPVEVIDQLLQRHTLETATVGLARHTRERRAQMQKSGGGSTSELGLDNMSAIVVRFLGARRPGAFGVLAGQRRRSTRPEHLEDATLLTVHGTRGGPSELSGGQFALIGLAGHELVHRLVPRYLRGLIELEHEPSMSDRMGVAYLQATHGEDDFARLAMTGVDEHGVAHSFTAGWADLDELIDVQIGERSVTAARDTLLQRFVYSPRLWASSLAAACVFLLVSTAFATGTVRPAPPPAPTAVAGEPSPTPDFRPQMAIGGFELVAPAPRPTLTPTPTPGEGPAIEPAPEAPEVVEAAPSSCSNPLGLLCEAAPPTPAPAPVARPTPRPIAPVPPAPAQRAPAQPGEVPTQPGGGVIPVSSPAPAAESANLGPPPGSQLDRALKIASIANDQFNRSLEEPLANPTPEP